MLVLRVCVSVYVSVSLCACGRACPSVLQDEILEVLVVEESAGVLVICFVSTLHDAKVWNSTLQSVNSARGLCMCAECVESATRKVPYGHNLCVSTILYGDQAVPHKNKRLLSWIKTVRHRRSHRL